MALIVVYITWMWRNPRVLIVGGGNEVRAGSHLREVILTTYV